MKVLHVIPALAPRYGGPSTAVVRMVAALNQLPDVRAEIAATDADGPDGRFRLEQLPVEVPVHLFRRDWSEPWKVSLGMRRWLNDHAKDYDVAHIHALWSFATAAGARAAAKCMVPYVLRPAGMLSNYTWEHRGAKKRLYWRLVEKKTVRGAAAFHVTSDGEAAEVRAVAPKARVFVIPNGVEEPAFSQPKDPCVLRRIWGAAASGQPIMLFLSRLHPKKGIVDRLLPAMTRMRLNCVLAIVGADDPHVPGHSKEIEGAVEQFGLQDRVRLLGPQSGSERWSLFDGADLFVLPSHAENFGIVVAEAMARGCPVVVTDAVQSCSHVMAAGAGEVVSGDVMELAAALDRVLCDPDRWRTYGEAGRAYANEHFGWGGISQQIQHMYMECLAAR